VWTRILALAMFLVSWSTARAVQQCSLVILTSLRYLLHRCLGSWHILLRSYSKGIWSPELPYVCASVKVPGPDSVPSTFGLRNMPLDSVQHNDSEMRQRNGPRVRIQEQDQYPRRKQRRQLQRIAQFQRDWETIKTDLPPQLTRRHSESAPN
jgi:hypothetical protein